MASEAVRYLPANVSPGELSTRLIPVYPLSNPTRPISSEASRNDEPSAGYRGDAEGRDSILYWLVQVLCLQLSPSWLASWEVGRMRNRGFMRCQYAVLIRSPVSEAIRGLGQRN
jgi:hypothetical protein